MNRKSEKMSVSSKQPVVSNDSQDQAGVLDNMIQDLVVAVTQHQGVQFNSLKEAEAYAADMKHNMQHMFDQSQVIFKVGLEHLSQKWTGFVADICKKLLAHINQLEEVAKIVQTDIQPNPDALKLFSEAVNSFYDCGDFELEQSVLSVFLMLFPMYPQPYACYATFIWRKDGIEAAQTFYEQIVDPMENPVLDYFAADCFLKNNHMQRAEKLLQRALAATRTNIVEYRELRVEIVRLLDRCK